MIFEKQNNSFDKKQRGV